MASRRMLLKKLLGRSILKRRVFFLSADGMIVALVMYMSFWLRFNGHIPENYSQALPHYITAAIIVKLTFLLIYDLYDISWRFVGIEELLRLLKALTLASLSLGMILYLLRVTPFFHFSFFPRSILLIDYTLCLILIGTLRISKRAFLEGIRSTFIIKKERQKILIIGAGNAGEQIVRDIQRNTDSSYWPVGLVDDDPAKKGIRLRGVQILGDRKDLPTILKTMIIDEVLIALPSAHSKDIRDIYETIRQFKPIDKIKILPSTNALIDGKVTISQIKEIQLRDLLGRIPASIDLDVIKKLIHGKTLLITGAAGSIGSEITKTVVNFFPKNVVLFEQDETELYNLINRLKNLGTEVVPVIGDVKDRSKVENVFKRYSPQIILHAAAYKHVPILEFYPEEAVKTNLLGTKVVAECAQKFKAEKFIFISTDKAINPTSVMGATKRACEEMLKYLNQKDPCRFISVRFGNVLGSRGSVVPLFQEQIKKGGPVTITHPEMKRYFMIISEAVLLVLEAAAIGTGGEVFVLDMGDQLKILDLATELIKLSGFIPNEDIPITYTKIRPGEKLSEEIFSAEEGVETTAWERLLKAKCSTPESEELFWAQVEEIRDASSTNERDRIISLLKKIVPTYQPYNEKDSKVVWD